MPDTFRGTRLEANFRASQVVLFVFGFLFFVALALGMAYALRSHPERMLPWLCVPVMAFVALVFGQLLWGHFFSGRPYLRIDSQAVDALPFGPIRWDQVVAMQQFVVTVRGRPSPRMKLVVRNPGQYLQRNWLQRLFLTRARREAQVGELVLPVAMLDQSAETILAAAKSFRERVRPPLLELWLPGMNLAAVEQQLEKEAALARLTEITAQPDAAIADQFDEITRLGETLVAPDQMQALIETGLRRKRRLLWLVYAVGGLVVAMQLLRIYLRVHAG